MPACRALLYPLAALVAVPALAEPDPEQGAWLGAHCAGCHADTSSEAIPPLAGMAPNAFVAAMEAFRSGEREHLAMEMFARNLSKSDIADLAAWLEETEKTR